MSDLENFTTALLDALESDAVAERYRLMFQSLIHECLDPMNNKLFEALLEQQKAMTTLKAQNTEQEKSIVSLKREVHLLHCKVDDLEQHGRKSSVRIFGVPESGEQSVDKKLTSLFNQRMNVKPPVKLEEIEVCHRFGRPPNQTASHQPRDSVDARDDQSLEEVSERAHRPGPRPIICEFASRRIKARVMAERKSLKPTESPVNDSDDGEAPTCPPLDQPKIYMADDLTMARAKLAYLARELKRSKKIADTWVFDCRVMIKNLYNRISQVDSIADLEKYEWNPTWWWLVPIVLNLNSIIIAEVIECPPNKWCC